MNLTFDNTFTAQLPADPEVSNRRRQVYGACYSRIEPTPVEAPKLIAWSREVAQQLGLSEEEVASPAFLSMFAGNQLHPQMAPMAACYGGHQFGSWAGQLGDGRAISLGEVIATDGSRQELQLKGAGPTPYSRMGDGRAVMRSSVREFLCSEAMFHLGVPTTRALSLIGTGELIARDMFYDGNERLEPGAIVCRVAPSFLRFGNFELLTARNDVSTLKRLADYTIATHFPHLANGQEPGPSVYASWFAEVCRRTALMVAHWMRVGFVHGVLNTDNMSVLGLTIDYGPYGWLDDYNANWTPNTTDAAGRRYRFGAQPRIAGWNLARFGEALLPLVANLDALQEGLEDYAEHFERSYGVMMRAKLGLGEVALTTVSAVTPEELLGQLLELLQLAATDMTIWFRSLADVEVSESALSAPNERLVAPLLDAYYEPPSPTIEAQLAAWLRRYIRRCLDEGQTAEERCSRMSQVNPRYVLRNYMAQLAIDKAEAGDGSVVAELLEVLRRPYDEQPSRQRFAQRRPEWARHRPGCSMLSCSS